MGKSGPKKKALKKVVDTSSEHSSKAKGETKPVAMTDEVEKATIH